MPPCLALTDGASDTSSDAGSPAPGADRRSGVSAALSAVRRWLGGADRAVCAVLDWAGHPRSAGLRAVSAAAGRRHGRWHGLRAVPAQPAAPQRDRGGHAVQRCLAQAGAGAETWAPDRAGAAARPVCGGAAARGGRSRLAAGAGAAAPLAAVEPRVQPVGLAGRRTGPVERRGAVRRWPSADQAHPAAGRSGPGGAGAHLKRGDRG